MPTLPKRARAICLAAALALPVAGCSSQTAPGGEPKITDAAPGSYEYARQCFRALGLQALTSGSGEPTAQEVMDRARKFAEAAGKKEGKDPIAVMNDVLRFTSDGARSYQSMSGAEQAGFAKASQAFADICLKAQL